MFSASASHLQPIFYAGSPDQILKKKWVWVAVAPLRIAETINGYLSRNFETFNYLFVYDWRLGGTEISRLRVGNEPQNNDLERSSEF